MNAHDLSRGLFAGAAMRTVADLLASAPGK